MKDNVLNYIIRFLLGEDVSRTITTAIGYTADPTLFHRYNVVIIPSGFFDEKMYGKTISIPSLPLQEVEGIPLLFGTPEVKRIGATLIVHADIVASTYFLITRYEEMVRRPIRDEKGRFPGKESLPYRAGFLHRPIVDEYRILLRQWLQQTNIRVPEVKKEIKKIYLTHDVDAPFLYRSWKGFVRSLLDNRGITRSLRGKFGSPEEDPYYTFPSILQYDESMTKALGKKHVQSIYFFKSGGNTREDKPRYCLKRRDIQKLIKNIQDHKAAIGLHTSFQAGKNPVLIPKEKNTLEKATGKKIFFNRHHFLTCREPEDMNLLEVAGITDDFTMGYADVAGFRLGTSYPVRWINPVTRRLSPLKMHPLTIMDSTLSDPRYMGLTQEKAEDYCLELIRNIRQAGGELILLWHNTSFVSKPENFLHSLYVSILKVLSKK